jgi:hypothetical protein
MKFLIQFTLTLFVLLVSCNNDDDKPENPADALPPATQSGEQTFGCLIDGNPFFSTKIGNGQPHAFYQYVDGAYTLGISASRGADDPSKSINLGALDIEGLQTGTYTLESFESGNFFGEYRLDGGIVLDTSTGENGFGSLTITRFDDQEHIISGTFEFTVQRNNGEQIKITDGRFDLNYSN